MQVFSDKHYPLGLILKQQQAIQFIHMVENMAWKVLELILKLEINIPF